MNTPAEVEKYYECAMEYLLSDMAGRPFYFLRPDPADPNAYAYERHPLPHLEDVQTVQIINSKGELADFAVVNDAAGIRELLTHGAIEFHPWGAPAHDVEHADRLVFDVDPGEGVSSEQVKQAVRDVREYLQTTGLKSFSHFSARQGGRASTWSCRSALHGLGLRYAASPEMSLKSLSASTPIAMYRSPR
jgi:bifunctional non-homologous end joining protein LigD